MCIWAKSTVSLAMKHMATMCIGKKTNIAFTLKCKATLHARILCRFVVHLTSVFWLYHYSKKILVPISGGWISLTIGLFSLSLSWSVRKFQIKKKKEKETLGANWKTISTCLFLTTLFFIPFLAFDTILLWKLNLNHVHNHIKQKSKRIKNTRFT